MTHEVANLTPESFDAAVTTPDRACLVDFWAAWCSPCAAYEPVVMEAASAYAGRLALGRVDIVAWPQLAERCGVRSVPALVLFQEGKIARRIFGVREKHVLVSELARAMRVE